MKSRLQAGVIASLLFASCAQAQVGINLSLKDPNLIEPDELTALPGVTEATAELVVASRPVLSMMDLDQALADALDESERETLYSQLFRQIDLNKASREELLLIPGMTARMAYEFDEYRPYSSLDQFRREIGKYVDADEVARLEQYAFIAMNLNTASGEDFLTIPGMTDRMVHEFEEYRPYSSMEQFRREMGKYVDDNEVARLESYVTLD